MCEHERAPLALCFPSGQLVELLYLRAVCYHALGAAREAVRDYDDCLSAVPRGGMANATDETRQFQFLSFYQKDLVLYQYRSLDRRTAEFCPDAELPDVFKVAKGRAAL